MLHWTTLVDLRRGAVVVGVFRGVLSPPSVMLELMLMLMLMLMLILTGRDGLDGLDSIDLRYMGLIGLLAVYAPTTHAGTYGTRRTQKVGADTRYATIEVDIHTYIHTYIL